MPCAGRLNMGLMPMGSAMAKGGSGGSFAKGIFPVLGDGRVPEALYTATQRWQAAIPAPSTPTGTACHSLPQRL